MKAPIIITFATLAAESCATIDTDHAVSFCESQINEGVLRAHVEFLSSDQLGGRGVGTEGDILARKYIASQLLAAGCQLLAAGSTSVLTPLQITHRNQTSLVQRQNTMRHSGNKGQIVTGNDHCDPNTVER